MTKKKWVCYLLHFAESIGGMKQRAQHYLGTTNDLPARIARHTNGTANARLTTVFFEIGIGFVVARTWPGGKGEEKRLKAENNHRLLCPICRKEKNGNRGNT